MATQVSERKGFTDRLAATPAGPGVYLMRDAQDGVKQGRPSPDSVLALHD